MSTILEERRKIVAKIIRDFITEIKPFLISGKMFSTKNLNNIFFEEKIEELIEDKDFLEYKNGYIIKYFSDYRRKFKSEKEKKFFWSTCFYC